MFFKALTVAAVVSTAVAQRPANISICDYYTTALLTNNTAANQKTLLTLVVNTAVIGNYTQPNVGIAVPGILAKGSYNNVDVDLAPYFSGALASTNTGEDTGKSVSFLSGGGAAPLMENMPANDTTSAQYILLTHLYEYFGGLLGCSLQGTEGYDAYSGSNNMYEVHKFMALSAAEVGYFITQVALSAASFGVTQEDLAPVGKALNDLFGYKCSPETVVIPSQPAALQAICIDDTCPTSPNATCASYEAVVKPAAANSSNTETAPSGGNATSTASGTATGTATRTGTATGTATGTGAAATSSSNAAVQNVVGLGLAAVGGVAAFLL